MYICTYVHTYIFYGDADSICFVELLQSWSLRIKLGLQVIHTVHTVHTVDTVYIRSTHSRHSMHSTYAHTCATM